MHNKKELVVWEMADGESKADFRHWLDSMDTQLETEHGFGYPHSVLDNITRLPNDVSAPDLEKIIDVINAERTKSVSMPQEGHDAWASSAAERELPGTEF